MAFASTNQTALRVVEETTWGTTPDTPTLDTLRYTGESLNVGTEFVNSDEVRTDRNLISIEQVSENVTGSLEAELTYGTYDSLFEGAFFSTWGTTGLGIIAGITLSVTKTAGTPNTWKMETTANDFSTKNWVVGQFIKVTGFAQGDFYARVTSISSLLIDIVPSEDVPTQAAGDSVTIAALDYMRNGVTNKSYTLQKEFTDLSTPEYFNFTGCRINTLNFGMETGGLTTLSFDVLGKTGAMTETQFSGATVNPAGTTPVFSSTKNIKSIQFGDDPGANTYKTSSLSIDVDNALREQQAIGNLNAVGVEPGRLNVTANAEIYFENSTLWDIFKATTETKLTVVLEDADGKTYVIYLPRVKLTEAEVTSEGLDGDIFQTYTMQAKLDTTDNCMIQLNRTKVA